MRKQFGNRKTMTNILLKRYIHVVRLFSLPPCRCADVNYNFQVMLSLFVVTVCGLAALEHRNID